MAQQILLTKREAAAALSCSERHVTRLVSRGVIPQVKIGEKAVRYRVSDIEAAIDRLQAEQGAAR